MPFDPVSLAGRLQSGPLDVDGEGHRELERHPIRRALLELSEPLREGDAGSAKLLNFLAGVFAGSPYLSSSIRRHFAWVQRVLVAAPEAVFATILADAAAEAAGISSTREVMALLRKSKDKTALLIALADLGGIWNGAEATARLSQAADVFVGLAIRFLLGRAHAAGHYLASDPNDPENGSGLIVLGMGKLGGHELNYSSDIDLIVFFDRTAVRLAPQIEPQPFFVRLVRDLVHILQERTADGYVYRTDLRLRPDPGSTQAAISTEAAFNYYESQGQNWERAAFIKARAVAGDKVAGDTFLAALRPYVWRKYLDYNAIADIHAMKRQIHAVKGHAQIAIAGHNLKLGRGGIREVEFFVQSQQLIAGGRQPGLRTPQTVEALARLADLGWIAESARDELTSAYWSLRRIEHRLQMVDDRQVHTLPAESGLETFSRFCGFENLGAFEHELAAHMRRVEFHYAELFEAMPELTPSRVEGNLVFTGDTDDPETVETLRKLGFANPHAAIAAIKGWHYGRYRAMRSERAREILTSFTPALLEALSETSAPDLALSTFDEFLRDLPAALQLFSTLKANPELLRLLARVMGSAPRLARILSQRRRLLDGILDPGFFGLRPTDAELHALVKREVMAAGSYEDRLNRARVTGQEQAFSIGAAVLSGESRVEAAGQAYTALAEGAIEALLDAIQEESGAGLPPPAVIGMGKLGGGEMTASSDLDLIVIYDSPDDLAADGKDDGFSRHYSRITQRLIAALSAPTAEGILYPVDLRLRPSGKSGPVAVSLRAFEAYQRNEAWTWEHMALTRARPVAGPQSLKARLEAVITEVLTAKRDRRAIAADVQNMRDLVMREKGSADLWDVRNHRGGLLCVEFIAQFLQLANAAAEPAILDRNTIAALRKASLAGFIAGADAAIAIGAAGLYRDIGQILRLCTDGVFDPYHAPQDLVRLLLSATGEPDITRLEARLAESYAGAASLFIRYVR